MRIKILAKFNPLQKVQITEKNSQQLITKKFTGYVPKNTQTIN